MPKRAYSLSRPSIDRTGSVRPVEWIGSSLKDLRALPDEVRRVFGFALFEIQCGRHPRSARRLRGELSGLLELREDLEGDTYRVVYVVPATDGVTVLHAFKKKSVRGRSVPRPDLALIRERWRRVKQLWQANANPKEE